MTARKPTELKRALGNPGKRALPEPLTVLEPTPDTLEPPPTLGDDGARMWRAILSGARWIGATDLTNVRLLCEAMDRRSHLIAELASMGWVLYTDKGYAYQNPAAGALATTEAQITKWLSLLGLTPSDRGRLGVAEVKALSRMEEMRERRAQRLAGRPAG